MKKTDVQAVIPVALQELHDEGHERVYVDQLGQQVTRHDENYLKKRALFRGALKHVGIAIPELPSGHLRPSSYKMYLSLHLLEQTGVIAGEFEESQADSQSRRKQYFLNKPADAV